MIILKIFLKTQVPLIVRYWFTGTVYVIKISKGTSRFLIENSGYYD